MGRGKGLFHLLYDLEAGKAEKELLGAGVAETDGGLGVVTLALYLFYFAQAEALVLYLLTYCEVAYRGGCSCGMGPCRGR